MESWRKLKVWRKAHILVLEVYKITKQYPKEERYCLVSQMRRAAISVVANIVEGSKRKTKKDQRHFYVISDSSLDELKYYFILSYHLEYITAEQGKELMKRAREIGRMLNGLITYLS